DRKWWVKFHKKMEDEKESILEEVNGLCPSSGKNIYTAKALVLYFFTMISIHPLYLLTSVIVQNVTGLGTMLVYLGFATECPFNAKVIEELEGMTLGLKTAGKHPVPACTRAITITGLKFDMDDCSEIVS
ncbi:hypothetical protein KI387_016800, partial [Taxus chinensis]